MPMAKRRPGGYEVDRTATTRMMSQHRLSNRVPNIASWLSYQSSSPFVWLRGSPGYGKSVIASQIFNFLSAQGSIVVSHFCTSAYASSMQYDEVLKSMLVQIIRNSGHMASYVYGHYVRKRAASLPVLEQLSQIGAAALSDDLGHGRTVYVVIDGLDDLNVEKQKTFLSLLSRLSRDSLSRQNSALFKILVVARPTHLINECLRKRTVVSLSSEKDKLTEAIARYSEQRSNAYRSRFSDSVSIARQVAGKADGMFLWARLVLDYLTHNIFYTNQEIRDAVNTLPWKLAEFYERFLTQMIAKYLQDPKSIVHIDPDHAYLEHAIAATTCLSSGLDVFGLAYPFYDRYSGKDVSKLLSILSEVSQKVAAFSDALSAQYGRIFAPEPRLQLLKSFPPLFEIAKGILLARNQKTADCAHDGDDMRVITSIRDVLGNYQVTIRECLSIHELPGITAEELAQFQQDYRREAFTCRFKFCSRASQGFETDKQRADHETSHAPPLKCPVPKCQYPSFPSSQALKNHERKCHDSVEDAARMKSVRKIGHLNISHEEAKTNGRLKRPPLEMYSPPPSTTLRERLKDDLQAPSFYGTDSRTNGFLPISEPGPKYDEANNKLPKKDLLYDGTNIAGDEAFIDSLQDLQTSWAPSPGLVRFRPPTPYPRTSLPPDPLPALSTIGQPISVEDQ
ncbi:hypothetical protein F5Y14DRAFT_455694 [Nemania sp. NC0429]|nr:hypothetical protein F5Y14DRAFT_455694 [Nemania sp. NC0429]